MEDLNTAIDKEEQIRTWNGALSYETVNNPLVELFFKSVRDIECEDYRSIYVKSSKNDEDDSSNGIHVLEDYFDRAWEVDPLRTLKFVFYLRDCREGKGEKKLFRALIRHMRQRGLQEHVENNLEYIPEYGSWKDLLLCFLGTELEEETLSLFAKQLKLDRNSKTPSLCGKYAPSENCAFDKKHNVVFKLCTLLKCNQRTYRKNYITPLREKLNIVERDMCNNDWENINFERVPSIANINYKKAFIKHDEYRYNKYLESVKKGESKINTSVLMPHQIIGPYLRSYSKIDYTIEAQWISFITDREQKWPKGFNVLPIIDVSASMETSSNPNPISVAISLGLTFSLLNETPAYNGKFITFHTTPQLFKITGTTLKENVDFIKSTPWGGSTDLQKSFDLILDTALLLNVKNEDMPKVLLILSDMQFNSADNKTNWDLVEKKYKDAGYTRPMIIFWNLSGKSKDFPVPNDRVNNCILISGYNDNIMYSLLDGNGFNPEQIVMKALDKQRYNAIQLA